MSTARGLDLRRRLRSAGGRLLRRYRLLPGGMPDGLGEDAALQDAVLEGDVVVYFPDTVDSLYQLRGWYGPLRELHREQGVTVVCMDSRTAAAVRTEGGLPVVSIALEATLTQLLLRSDTKLVLYVSFNPLNTASLGLRSAIHVSLLHGDSDKSVSVSNQVKAYDFSFVAGQAAIDRFERYTSLFEASTRCIPVGRPSLDTDTVTPSPREHGRPVVLYAPTWEGAQVAVAYSSLRSHAAAAVASLLEEGLDVLYRPHPLTGVRVAEFGQADAALRAQVLAGGGRVSTDRPLEQDVADADLLLCDVSAVAGDWLPSGKPLIVTTPVDEQAHDAGTELLRVVTRLTAEESAAAGRIARAALEEDTLRAQREALTEYYLGDTSPGASLQRFLEACTALAQRRDVLWARIQAEEGGVASASHPSSPARPE